MRDKYKNNEALRIAMLGHKRVPSREGGIEIVVEELATRMVEKGHKVVCYNRSGHHVSGKNFDNKEVRGTYKGIKLKSVFTINRKGLSAVSASLAATLRAAFGKYDVVHFHAEGPCAWLWLAKVSGKRCICTVHGLDHKRKKWGYLASKYIMFGEKVAVRFADEIIVLSQGEKEYFRDTYQRDTVFVPNGVNSPSIYQVNKIKDEYGLSKDGYYLFLGRIVPEKGIHYLIEAFKKVSTDKKLVIAGGASDTEEYYKEIKKRAEDDERIMFTGFIQGQILEELYSNAYVYILPSDLEGMPLSLLEAMSYGNCCLVSDIPECVEVVEDKAIVFKRGEVSDLTKQIQNTCENLNLVKRYKQDATDFICNKYKWDDVVQKTLALYMGGMK